MAEKEIPEALSSLFEAVLAYQDTQEGLARVRSMAESLWGKEWRQKLPSILQDTPDELQVQVKTNIDRALAYEKAASVWADASRLLDPKRPIDVAQIKAQLPEMQRWLAIFGKAGQDLLAKVQQRIAEAEANPQTANAVTASTNMYGLSVEQLWNFDHFLRLKSYYDQTISRTSARCVHLGGLELSQYPYFGYILDLLDEIITFGIEILTPPYTQIIQQRYKGGEAALRKVLSEYKKEFNDNAPPEMVMEDETVEEVKERLGQLADNSEPEDEDIGPAPDGFEAPEELTAPMVKAPQKMPAKGPAVMKVPIKRPVPTG